MRLPRPPSLEPRGSRCPSLSFVFSGTSGTSPKAWVPAGGPADTGRGPWFHRHLMPTCPWPAPAPLRPPCSPLPEPPRSPRCWRAGLQDTVFLSLLVLRLLRWRRAPRGWGVGRGLYLRQGREAGGELCSCLWSRALTPDPSVEWWPCCSQVALSVGPGVTPSALHSSELPGWPPRPRCPSSPRRGPRQRAARGGGHGGPRLASTEPVPGPLGWGGWSLPLAPPSR